MTGSLPPRPDLPQPDDRSAGSPGDSRRTGPPEATWRAIEALPLALLAYAATFVIWLFLAAIFPPRLGEEAGENPSFFVLANLALDACLIGAVVLWVRRIDRAPLAALGLPPRHPWADAVVGALTGVALVFVAGALLAVVREVAELILGHEPADPDQIPQTVRGSMLALSGIVVVVLAPIGEEAFFRGYLYKGLRRRFRVWSAALISGAVFGLVHFQGIRFLLIVPPLVVVGFVLALVYERRQSLLASIAAHSAFNLAGFVAIFVSRS